MKILKEVGADKAQELFKIIQTNIEKNKENLDPMFYASIIASYPSGYLRAREVERRVADEEGSLGDRHWFEDREDGKQVILNSSPEWVTQLVRFWDLAGTEQKMTPQGQKNDPDETMGTLLGTDAKKERLCIEDQIGGAWAWATIKQNVVAVAKQDGQHVKICFEQEPGSGGKNQVAELMEEIKKQLPSYDVSGQGHQGPCRAPGIITSPTKTLRRQGETQILREIPLHLYGLSNDAPLNQLLHRSKPRQAAEMMAHHPQDLGPPACLDHPPRVGHRVGNRFIHEHVSSMLRSCEGLLGMKGIGRGQVNAFHILSAKHVLKPVFLLTTELFTENLSSFRSRVKARDQFHLLALEHHRADCSGPCPCPDDGNPYRLCVLQCGFLPVYDQNFERALSELSLIEYRDRQNEAREAPMLKARKTNFIAICTIATISAAAAATAAISAAQDSNQLGEIISRTGITKSVAERNVREAAAERARSRAVCYEVIGCSENGRDQDLKLSTWTCSAIIQRDSRGNPGGECPQA